jgi:transcriptional regulator with XRE-family HTH domain
MTIAVDRKFLYSRIGKRVKEARKAAGATQSELAKVVGISRASLANYERGVITSGLSS